MYITSRVCTCSMTSELRDHHVTGYKPTNFTTYNRKVLTLCWLIQLSKNLFLPLPNFEAVTTGGIWSISIAIALGKMCVMIHDTDESCDQIWTSCGFITLFTYYCVWLHNHTKMYIVWNAGEISSPAWITLWIHPSNCLCVHRPGDWGASLVSEPKSGLVDPMITLQLQSVICDISICFQSVWLSCFPKHLIL